jgi:ATP-dependent Clp protease ATP-binding subunit ClpE
MTSNAGTSFKSANIGFGGQDYHNMERKVQSVLREVFRPEFLNRVDSVAVFTELERDDLKAIIKIMLDEVVTEAAGNGISLQYDAQSVPEYFLEEGYQSGLGARPFRTEIQKKIEDTLSELYLKGDISKGDRVYVSVGREDRAGGEGRDHETDGGIAGGISPGGESGVIDTGEEMSVGPDVNARNVLRFVKI